MTSWDVWEATLSAIAIPAPTSPSTMEHVSPPQAVPLNPVMMSVTDIKHFSGGSVVLHIQALVDVSASNLLFQSGVATQHYTIKTPCRNNYYRLSYQPVCQSTPEALLWGTVNIRSGLPLVKSLTYPMA